MSTLPLLKLENLKEGPVRTFTKEFIEVYYPHLFLVLNRIGYKLEAFSDDGDLPLLQSILKKMNEELDEMFRKEKLVLFPYLERLESEQKKSEGCEPFKSVKGHYTTLLTAVQHFKAVLQEGNEEPSGLEALKGSIDVFEQALIKLQYYKEKFLFQPYRECRGGNCKNL